MAAMLPIIMGGRILQVAAPRAIALVEAGMARMLPSMRTIGSQSAGPSAAGSYFRTGAPNLPAMADRPGLIGKGLAGGAAAGSLAMGGPEASVSPEGRVPIPSGMISQLDERGTAAPPIAAPPPVSSDMSARFLDGPSTYSPDYSGLGGGADSPREQMMQRALAATAAPAKSFAEAPPPPRRPVEPPRPAEDRQPVASGPSARDLWTRYNESESPADFVRADRFGRAEGGGIPEGMMGARPMPMPNLDLPPMDGPPPMGDMPPLGGMSPTSKPAAGAGAGGRDAAINKALEIIHHLVIRGR
jgi:hypothetical protein